MHYCEYYQSDLHSGNVSPEVFTNCDDTIKMYFVCIYSVVKTVGKITGKVTEIFPFSLT